MPDATATRDAPSRAAREETPQAALETSRVALGDTTRPALDVSARARIRSLLGRRAIAYHPAFAAIGGGATAGLFLAQLFYWHDRGRDPDGWIYKTQAAWEEETGLTRWQQETARRKLRARGILEEKLAGLPARVHYRLDVMRLIELLSARVELGGSASGSASGSVGGSARGSARGHTRPLGEPSSGGRHASSHGPRQAVDSSPSSSWERHNQDCGIPTNKSVGIPQTSSRDSRIHAETTREDSREQGAERLAAGFQESSSGRSSSDRLTPSWTASSWPSLTQAAACSVDRLDGTSGVTPDVPSQVMCSLHGVPMRLREKDGDRWYSHRLDDGAWCKGARGDYALGDQSPAQHPVRGDPQSIESRRQYLAWADPEAHLTLERGHEAAARRASYAAQWEAVRASEVAWGDAGPRVSRRPDQACGPPHLAEHCSRPIGSTGQPPSAARQDGAGHRTGARQRSAAPCPVRPEHGSQESIGSDGSCAGMHVECEGRHGAVTERGPAADSGTGAWPGVRCRSPGGTPATPITGKTMGATGTLVQPEGRGPPEGSSPVPPNLIAVPPAPPGQTCSRARPERPLAIANGAYLLSGVSPPMRLAFPKAEPAQACREPRRHRESSAGRSGEIAFGKVRCASSTPEGSAARGRAPPADDSCSDYGARAPPWLEAGVWFRHAGPAACSA